MKIYDISQELYGSCVFPGDPSPEKEVLMSTAAGDMCNLTAVKMCAHNGTHIDAPFHFIEDGKTVDMLDLCKTVGYAFVAAHHGELCAEDAKMILKLAEAESSESARRILIKGDAVVSLEAAEVFASAGVHLLGNESQTVGPEDAPMAVHKKLLGAEVVLLEGIRLGEVQGGVYFLAAAPINLADGDGAPCRAILIGE